MKEWMDLLITIDQSRRPYSASGVSLYVSDDPQGSDDDWTRPPAFPDQDGWPGI